MRGCDFAWRPAGLDLHQFARDLRRQEFGFVVRYLSYDPSKNLTRDEIAAYRRAGLHIVTVWETTADAVLGGAERGRHDALSAKAQLAALGAPEHAPVYFAVDFDVSSEQMATAVNAYLDETAFVLTEDLNGVYGGYAAVGARHVRYRWQTLAWSGGRWSSGDALMQSGINSGVIDGVAWDIDESKGADFGQWRWPAHPRRRPRRTPGRLVASGGRKVKGKTQQEPVMTAGTAAAVLAPLAAYLQHKGLHLTATQLNAALTIIVALAGCATALTARPARMGAYTAALGTLATATQLFWMHVPAAWVGYQVPVAAMVTGLLLRGHVSPKWEAIPLAVAQNMHMPAVTAPAMTAPLPVPPAVP